MAVVLLVLRPLALTSQNLVSNQAIAANVSNLIRWQNHWYVARQTWAFFQNDFAGRIANKVMPTGPALRESLVALITGVWYILVYGTAAVFLLASADPWLALPVLLWFCAYLVLLRTFVPRMRDRSRDVSEARSVLTGRIVDTYTNILTVKLFARARQEDAYVREAVEEHTGLFHASLRLNTLFSLSLSTLNALLVTSIGGLAIALWTHGVVEVGTVAMALPLAWQIISISGWVAMRVTELFENVGVVQEGMSAIAKPIALIDKADAAPLKVSRGEIRFEDVRFGYGRETGVIAGLTLNVRPGEKIGLVGRSGAGKSTLVNLLLRFFDVEDGRILIDGQDIAEVTQESLRAQISVVTQDTSLLHRSIRDNIGYGRPGASDADITAAAKLAHAHEFILDLEDWKAPARLRLPGRRARRKAVRRPAPAHRHRPRDPEERADPGARRSDLRARQRGRGRDPGEPRHPHLGDCLSARPLARRQRSRRRGHRAGSLPARVSRHRRASATVNPRAWVLSIVRNTAYTWLSAPATALVVVDNLEA